MSALTRVVFPMFVVFAMSLTARAAAHGWSASLVHARLGEERVAGTVPHYRRAVNSSRDPQSCVMRQKPILNTLRIELLKLDSG